MTFLNHWSNIANVLPGTASELEVSAKQEMDQISIFEILQPEPDLGESYYTYTILGSLQS